MYCTKCKSGSTSKVYCNICGTKLISSMVVCPHSATSGFETHETYLWSKFCDVCGKPVQEEMNRIIKGGK